MTDASVIEVNYFQSLQKGRGIREKFDLLTKQDSENGYRQCSVSLNDSLARSQSRKSTEPLGLLIEEVPPNESGFNGWWY